MDYRHEWKHEITPSDLLALRARLRAVARPDPHASGGSYLVRSLYFDTPDDQALREKLNGVSRREKFRIRYYNADPSQLFLEKKSKWNALGSKQSAPLTRQQVQALLTAGPLGQSLPPLLWELCSKMRGQGLRPRTVVDYTREPYLFAPGNVRVTLDYNLRTSPGCAGFLDPSCVTLPVPGDPIILEVKWDAFLPDIIRDAVQLEGRRTAAFSKYAACRAYG